VLGSREAALLSVQSTHRNTADNLRRQATNFVAPMSSTRSGCALSSEEEALRLAERSFTAFHSPTVRCSFGWRRPATVLGVQLEPEAIDPARANEIAEADRGPAADVAYTFRVQVACAPSGRRPAFAAECFEGMPNRGGPGRRPANDWGTCSDAS